MNHPPPISLVQSGESTATVPSQELPPPGSENTRPPLLPTAHGRLPIVQLLTLLAFACLPFTIALGGAFLLVALVVQVGTRGQAGEGGNQGVDPIYYLMIAFCLLTLAQTAWVPDPWSHLAGLSKLYVVPFLVFWLVNRQRLTRPQKDLLVLVVAGSAAVQAGFGIFEYFGGRLDWRFLPLTVGDVTVYLLDLSLQSVAPNRAHGILLYPTLLSGLILLTAPLVCGLVERPGRNTMRFPMAIALLLLLVCLALTFTRSGWLALLPTLLAFAALSRRWKTVVMALTGFALCLVVLASLRPAVGQQLETRAHSITSLQDVSNAQRLSIWRSYVAVVRDYFWTGTGINSGGMIFPHYRRADYPGALINPHAHNWYLQVANESGVPLALVFFGVVLLPMRRAWRETANGERRTAEADRIWRAALTCSVLGFLLVNGLDYLAHEVRISLVFWLSLALLNRTGD